MTKFVEELPHKLKLEMSMYVYQHRYSKLNFFKDQSPEFIAWICPLFKPDFYDTNQFVYQEGDPVNEMLFMTEGSAAFVLPAFKNKKYISIQEGDYFGVLDIVASFSEQ